MRPPWEMLLFREVVNYCLAVLLRPHGGPYNRLFPRHVDNLVEFAFDTPAIFYFFAPLFLSSSIRNKTCKGARVVGSNVTG